MSEREEIIKYFISGTIKEIQSPVQGIVEKTQFLLDHYDGKDFEYIGYNEFKDMMQMLKEMRNHAQHCLSVTEKLVQIQKRSVGITRRSCNINDMIKEVIKMCDQYVFANNIQVKTRLSSKIPELDIDPIECRQIFLNIFSNAVQSISVEGGEVYWTTKYKKEDNIVKIECRDTGVGISKEMINNIFDPFFTTKHQGAERHTGLGLCLVDSILKNVGGKIKVKSNLKDGTVVRILLPVLRREDAAV